MPKCTRNNCNEQINRLSPAGRIRLCEKHYETYCRNRQNKKVKKESKCLYCQISLANSKSSKYCSVYHRQLASRKLQNGLLTHSYWYRTESFITRSSLELASTIGVEDVADLVKLHQYRAKHQRSYFLTMDNKDKKPEPLFPVELCHIYPVSKGGMNIALNILVAPKQINRMLRDQIPDQHQGFPGIKGMGESIPLNGSLYDSLVERSSIQEVIESLGEIKLNHFHCCAPRPIKFRGMGKEIPLFTLFVEELYRLGLEEWGALFMSLKRIYERLVPFMLELIAALSFYAILTGDRDRFLFRLRRFNDWFLSEYPLVRHPFRQGGLGSFERILILMLHKYLLKFFAVDSSDVDAVIGFYNSFFSIEVVARGMPGEILYYYWQWGKRCQSVTPFIIGFIY